MRAAVVVLIVVVAAVLINAIRGGEGFALMQVFPGMAQGRPGLYHVAGVVMLLITLWGLGRLLRRGDEND